MQLTLVSSGGETTSMAWSLLLARRIPGCCHHSHNISRRCVREAYSIWTQGGFESPLLSYKELYINTTIKKQT
jgi:hypothetical protein